MIREMLAALEAWEHWYNVDSTEFNRDNARELGRKAISKARLLLNAEKLSDKDLDTLLKMAELMAAKSAARRASKESK
jgi:hypothetical protein